MYFNGVAGDVCVIIETLDGWLFISSDDVLLTLYFILVILRSRLLSLRCWL
jgi:hypothetical protein